MRRGVSLAVLAVVVLMTVSAFGQQWGGGRLPRDGACFYADLDFRGRMFCVEAGEVVQGVPAGFDDRITSIQIFGRASVIVFDDPDFRGASDRLDQSAPDLRLIRKSADRSHTWNDRISSVRVEWLGGGRGRGHDRDDRGRDDNGWNRDRDRDDWRDREKGPRWGRGPQPRDGACFFRQADFRGDYFCLERGANIAELPREFNDAISSIRLFGNARVAAFSNPDFRGPRAGFDRDIRDLRNARERRDWDRDWNNRISSIQVR